MPTTHISLNIPIRTQNFQPLSSFEPLTQYLTLLYFAVIFLLLMKYIIWEWMFSVLILTSTFCMPTVFNNFFPAITTCNYWFSSKKIKEFVIWLFVVSNFQFLSAQLDGIIEVLLYFQNGESFLWEFNSEQLSFELFFNMINIFCKDQPWSEPTFPYQCLKILKKWQIFVASSFISKRDRGRVEHPLLARDPSLARFFDNLTEITCVKERIVEFFFH